MLFGLGYHSAKFHSFNATRALLHRRTYALSRFPGRGVGASRRKPSLTNDSNGREYDAEPEPSEEQSQAWHTSQRPPASDPKEGLENLLMTNDVLVVERQIEMLNIFLGFEQSNRYSISNEAGDTLGYIAEEPRGFFSVFSRQIFRTHRPFRAIVMDAHGSPIMWLRRPFAWINSRMYVQRLMDGNTYTPEGEPVLDTFAEVQQIWHPIRRKYDLFLRSSPKRVLSLASDPQPEPSVMDDMFDQFARVDSGFLAWNFKLEDRAAQEMAHIGRAFRGFGREIFTDTGRYFVRFTPDPTPQLMIDPRTGQMAVTHSPANHRPLSLEERALTLALAVNIDFDYFSRHSHGGMGMGGMWISTGE